MNEILAVVAFLVLVGLLASGMERDHRQHKIGDESHSEPESNNLLGAVALTTPELPAPRSLSLLDKPIETR